MLRTATLLVLASFALLLAPPASAEAADTCVQYAYVADYQWYYLCANPGNLSCPVYFKRVVGVTETRDCVVPSASVSAICTPFTGDLDYRWRYCAQANVRCPVYHETQGGVKTCYP